MCEFRPIPPTLHPIPPRDDTLTQQTTNHTQKTRTIRLGLSPAALREWAGARETATFGTAERLMAAIATPILTDLRID